MTEKRVPPTHGPVATGNQTNWVAAAGLIAFAVLAAAIILALVLLRDGRGSEDEPPRQSFAGSGDAGTVLEASSPTNPLDDYADAYLSDNDVRMYAKGPANIRDYPTPNGSEIVGSVAKGDQVEGRWVEGITPNTRWLRIVNTQGARYIWEGSLSLEKPTTAADYRDRYLSGDINTLAARGPANVRSFPGPSMGKVYFQLKKGDVVRGRWVQGLNPEERYLKIMTERGPAYIWEDNLR